MSDTRDVVFVLPDLGGGGAQRVMLRFASGLADEGPTARILVLGGARTLEGDVPAGVPVERLGEGGLRQGLPKLIGRLRSLRPQAVVSVMGYMNLALLSARSLLPGGTKLIVREANTLASTLASMPRFVPGQWLYRSLYGRADLVIAPSRRIASEIGSAVPRVQSRIAVCPNPVDVDALRAAATKPVRAAGGGLRLVAAGRLSEQKGFDRLLPLIAQLRSDTHLTIYGEGPDRGALERQVVQLGLQGRVAMPGFTRALPAALAGADAFVLPSRWEGLPNVVLEALALGVPVIASPEAGVEEVAALVSAGALTIAPVDQRFAAAMAAVAPAGSIPDARASLLSAGYGIAEAQRRFSHLVRDCLAART